MPSAADGMAVLEAGGKDHLQIAYTSRGATITQADAVLSRVLAEPGPTHSFFDLIAAAAAALSSRGSFLMLGFAGGGIVAPLRAMAFREPIEGVDLSLEGAEIFHNLSASWSGQVNVHQAEAQAWLSETDRRFDVILEDLSILRCESVTKPSICTSTLPLLIARRLSPHGIAIFNLLASPEMPWRQQLRRVARPFESTIMIRDEEYENRLVIGARTLPAAGLVARDVGGLLRKIGSKRAGSVKVRTLSRHRKDSNGVAS